MPARATITINDRETTPVAHAFVPNGGNGDGVADFRKAGVVPEADELLRLTYRFTGGFHRTSLWIKLPTAVTETINGVSRSVVDRSQWAELKFVHDKRTTLQERKNLIGLAYNSLAPGQTMLNTFFTELEKVY